METCGFIVPDGIWKGFICPNIVTINGLCENCNKRFDSNINRIIDCYVNQYYAFDILYQYICKKSFTQENLYYAFRKILNTYSNDKVLYKLLCQHKFFQTSMVIIFYYRIHYCHNNYYQTSFTKDS